MPAHHTTNPETNPVFHVVKSCPDRRDILPGYLRRRLKKRAMCEECLKLLRDGHEPMLPK